MWPRWLSVVLAGVVLAGCVSEPTLGVAEQADRLVAARRQALAAARLEFARRVSFPRVERFAQGTVIVAHAELVGAMDREFVRLRVTYVNESQQTYDRIRLHFSVRDGMGRVQGRQDVDFVMPLDYRFTPGNSYTDEVDVPTGGAERSPGWDLGVELEAEAW